MSLKREQRITKKGMFKMNEINTIAEYMADESRVSPVMKEKIKFEVALIGKMIEAREAKGLSQRELARLSGVRQPAIARMESMKAMPQVDTLIKVLNPLGYTLSIVPIQPRTEETA
jgi:ribosome-binding protein aMBF1 (putative translation factor)